MKILIINTLEQQGGAAKAAKRLHTALLDNGQDSRMLVQSKQSDDPNVFSVYGVLQPFVHRIRTRLDTFFVRFRYRQKVPLLFSSANIDAPKVLKCIETYQPDIVHLHWINGGMLSIEDIARIKVPIVWTLHDSWAFTGGCHVPWDCTKYENECGSCPMLQSRQEHDSSRNILIRKKRSFAQTVFPIVVIALSTWIESKAKKSSLFEKNKVIHIPNTLDTKIFAPREKKKAQIKLQLPTDKKLVLVATSNAGSDINKGLFYVHTAMQKEQKAHFDIVIFGEKSASDTPNFGGRKIHYLGHIDSDIKMSYVYSAVDVVVVPSVQENLSNTIMESLSCGTPVVAFDIGGNKDMIEHTKNGYLAKPLDVQDLSAGIDWILQNNKHDFLCTNAIKKIKERFDSTVVVPQYVEMYKNIISETVR